MGLIGDSTPIPPTELSLREDIDTTPSFILTEYDQNLRILDGGYEGLKVPRESLENRNHLQTGHLVKESEFFLLHLLLFYYVPATFYIFLLLAH